MNIHLPAILMFTRGTRFWHTAIWWKVGICWGAVQVRASSHDSYTQRLAQLYTRKQVSCERGSGICGGGGGDDDDDYDDDDDNDGGGGGGVGDDAAAK